MAELKQQVLTTDLAVQQFKANNNLISSGGKLVNEQQLGEVNTQLVDGPRRDRARRGPLRAHQDYPRRPHDRCGGDRGHRQLRHRAAANEIRQRRAAPGGSAAKLGPDHDAVVNLRAEMKEYERLMFEELGRIAEVYRSELDIAKRREEALKENFCEPRRRERVVERDAGRAARARARVGKLSDPLSVVPAALSAGRAEPVVPDHRSARHQKRAAADRRQQAAEGQDHGARAVVRRRAWVSASACCAR